MAPPPAKAGFETLMEIFVPVDVLQATTGASLERARIMSTAYKPHQGEKIATIWTGGIDDEDLKELHGLLVGRGFGKEARVIQAHIDVRNKSTDFKVPSFDAFQTLLTHFLKENADNGWLFKVGNDGIARPWAITAIRRVTPSGNGLEKTPSIRIEAEAFAQTNGRLKMHKTYWSFTASCVQRKHIATILENAGLFAGSESLIAAHKASVDRFNHLLENGFGQQFVATGPADDSTHYGKRKSIVGHKMVMDLTSDQIRQISSEVETSVFEAGHIPAPCHTDVAMFDLKLHETFWVNCANFKDYTYQPELREKLILPQTHRDLLDVLTTDTDVLTSDVVEGKTAGNVILCKGPPGVGKTLTAEIYSEVTRKPLYVVHAGVLGTTAAEIAKNLREVLDRAQRWQCILLIDEADVYVAERADNIDLNAIVAEFLMVLETYTSLMFLTTNRPKNIDDAVISRCAAIIDYQLPEAKDSLRIWNVMADNFKAELDAALAQQLVAMFPSASPRDIKMLFRLTMRMAASKNKPLSADLFRQCAMFRAMQIGADTNKSSEL